MRRLVAAGLALVAVSVAAQSPMYSDYPWGLVQNGVDQGPVWNINCISPGLACSVDGGNGTVSVNVAGGGGALADAGFVTWYADPGLTNERVLSAGNYTVADYGTAGQAQVDWQHGLTCSSGQALTTASTSTLACTSTITASDLACSGCVSDVELENNYSGVGVCTNQFVRGVNDNAAPSCSAVQLGSDVAGTLPQPNGGTGTGALTCGTAQFLSSNGTAYSCSQGVNGSATAGQATYWTGTYALSGESTYTYDATNNRLHVGAAASDTGSVNGYATTTYAVVARNAITENSGGSIKTLSSSVTGYGGVDFFDDGDSARQAAIGYGGRTHGTTDKRNAFYVDYLSNANGFAVWGGSTRHSLFNATGFGVGSSPLSTISAAKDGFANYTGRSAGASAGSYVQLQRARGTVDAPTILSNGDFQGGVIFSGYDGAAYRDNAAIYGIVDAAPGTSDMPGSLSFRTAADGTTTLTERAKISNQGNFTLNTPTSGNALVFPDLTGMNTNAGTIYRLTSDFTTTSTGFVDITGLTHSVGLLQPWIFEARIIWQSSSTAGGPGLSVNSTGTISVLDYTVEYQTFANATGGTMTTRHDTAADAMAALTTTTAATTSYVAIIRGVLLTGAVSSGTFSIRLRSSNALYTMTAKQGSYLVIRKGFN